MESSQLANQYLFGEAYLPGGSEMIISGHTAIAFALATVLSMITKNTKWQMPLFAGAVLLGYSRIYLAPHSWQQIIIGAITGTGSAVVVVYFSYYFNTSFSGLRKLRNWYKKGMHGQQDVQPGLN